MIRGVGAAAARLAAPGAAGAEVRLRMALIALLLLAGEVRGAPAWAGVGAEAMRPPAGAEWLRATALALGQQGGRLLLFGFFVCLLLGGVDTLRGRERRWPFGLAALVAVVLLGLPQLSGTTRHVHHLVWLLAAVGLARQPEHAIRAAWLLLAAVYFWPGVHKVATLGGDFFLTDHVLQNARWKWLQFGHVPPLVGALPPWAWRVGAAGVVLLELTAPLCFAFERGRRVAIPALVAFHLLTEWAMGIAFPSLWLVLLALWPIGDTTTAPAGTERRGAGPVAAVVAIVALVLAAHLAGLRGRVEGWPFACYPTFDRRAGPEMPALRLSLTLGNGETRVWEPWRWRDGDRQLRWGQLWALSLDRRPERRCPAIAAFVRQHQWRLGGATLLGATAERVWLDVDPAAHGAIVRQRELCRLPAALLQPAPNG